MHFANNTAVKWKQATHRIPVMKSSHTRHTEKLMVTIPYATAFRYDSCKGLSLKYCPVFPLSYL